MKLIRTLSAHLLHITPKPQTHIGTSNTQWLSDNKARFNKILVVILVAASFSASPATQAASTKVTLSAKSTTIAGAALKVTAQVTPRRSGVAITLLSGVVSARKVYTNAQGNAVFNLKLVKDTKLTARVTARPSVRSKSVAISVFHRTNLLVDWPSYAISCTDEGISAYVSPALAGRKVTMQYQSNGEWIDEDTQTTDKDGYVYLKLIDNSNAESQSTTILADERIVVKAKGRYLAVSAKRTLEYEGCSSTTGEVIDAYYDGAQAVGTPEIYTWELLNTDPLSWSANDATMQIDLCNEGTDMCDAEDPDMPWVYQDKTTVTGDDSGTFSWTPTVAGDYVIRISLWDNNQMLTNVSTGYAITD